MKEETKKKYQSFGIKGITKRFRMACQANRLDIVHYLLTSNELKQNVDIHTGDDYAFRMACKKGHLELVKYLLECPDLKEHANMHVYNDIGFKQANENGHYDVVNYLLKFKLDKELKVNGNSAQKVKI